jgi:hypothetical protein
LVGKIPFLSATTEQKLFPFSIILLLSSLLFSPDHTEGDERIREIERERETERPRERERSALREEEQEQT